MRAWPLLFVIVGCSSSEAGTDGGTDATTKDAPADVGVDAAKDGGADATVDASNDASDASDANTDHDAQPTDAATDAQDAGAAYAHTIAIDGTNDFAAEDAFVTTSTGYTGYISWDATYVYLGMQGADVSAGSATKWLLVYFGGTNGTTTGVTYNTQTPALAFAALFHVRWKSDNTFTDALTWTGSWTSAGWSFTSDVYQSGTYIEVRILRSNLNNPTTSLKLHLSMINEAANVEGTYAGVPSTSFTDGYNPTYAKYFDFDLTAPTAPNAYTAKP